MAEDLSVFVLNSSDERKSFDEHNRTGELSLTDKVFRDVLQPGYIEDLCPDIKTHLTTDSATATIGTWKGLNTG